MSDELFNKDQLEVLEDKEKDDKGSQNSHIIYDELFNEDQLEVLEDKEDDNEVIHQGNRHVYFSLKPPTNVSDIQYNPKNLPLRKHKNYIQDVTTIENMNGSSRKRKMRAK
ncbi:803_t:CDS:2, partial [Funneliformis caledonium]